MYIYTPVLIFAAFSGTVLPLLTTFLSRMRMYIVWSNTFSRRGCWPSTLWTQNVLLCPEIVLVVTWQLLSHNRYRNCCLFYCPCTGTWSKPTSVSGSKFVFAKSVGAVRIKGGLGWVYSHPIVFFQTSNITCFLWNRGLDLEEEGIMTKWVNLEGMELI